MQFTTSWDDGYALDTKLADLLERYNVTGTFYVCPRKQHGHDMLSEGDIRSLADRHEIGAHTLRHSKLTEVSAVEAKQEIEDSKTWIEQVTGKECEMFCYPYGFYNEQVEQLVRDAGYKGARTTEDLCFEVHNAFTMPTTLQVAPFPRRKKYSRWWHRLDIYGPLRVKQSKLRSFHVKKEDTKSWLALSKALFDRAKENDFLFHLWGHSHEIEAYDMWGDLELFLGYVKEAGVKGVTNQEALATRS